MINTSNNLSSHRRYIGQDCKPGSVSDDHLSWPDVATRLMRPPPGQRRAAAFHVLFGLAPDGVYTGDMLPYFPVSSYLTISTLPRHDPFRRCVSVALSYSYLRRTLSGIHALWSRTFLIHPEDARDHLSYPKYDFNIYNI